jgi:hypothetical protein
MVRMILKLLQTTTTGRIPPLRAEVPRAEACVALGFATGRSGHSVVVFASRQYAALQVAQTHELLLLLLLANRLVGFGANLSPSTSRVLRMGT